MGSWLHDGLVAFSHVDPIMFSIGSLSVRWYGIAYIAGAIFVGILIAFFVKRWKIGISVDDILTVVLGSTVGVILGGRLGYVLFYRLDYYLANPTKILAFVDGGMSFHGGFIGCLLGAYIAARLIKIPFLTIFDLGCIGMPAGLFFGRLANFINGELWGKVSSVPWAITFAGAGPLRRHPSQLYEAILEGIILFIIIFVMAMRKPTPYRGELGGWFLVLYPVFRIFVEFYREPDVGIGFMFGGWLTRGMLLSVPMLIAGVLLLKYSYSHKQLETDDS